MVSNARLSIFCSRGSGCSSASLCPLPEGANTSHSCQSDYDKGDEVDNSDEIFAFETSRKRARELYPSD